MTSIIVMSMNVNRICIHYDSQGRNSEHSHTGYPDTLFSRSHKLFLTSILRDANDCNMTAARREVLFSPNLL
jgi:hypothetical protein